MTQSTTLKRRLAAWLKQFPPLRWGLLLGVRLFAPRHMVGAVGVVFNAAGQVLLVEHVFRPHYSWGLPGGWVEHGENPADAVRRELQEELNLSIEVKRLLLCEVQGYELRGTAPHGLGLAYYCRLAGEDEAPDGMPAGPATFEILSTRWVDPGQIRWNLAPLDRRAIFLAVEAFNRK